MWMTPVLDRTLRARSEEFERAGHLPDDVVAAMRDEGLFAQWVPAAYGGPQRTAQEGLDAIAEVAEADGAAGWCAMISMTTSLLGHLLPEDHGRALVGPDAILGGFAAPMGTATPVEGGLAVTGRWAWGSGVRHCTAVGGGVRVVDRGGAPVQGGPQSPYVFVDPVDVELLDTWHVAGLEGTGSTDYAVRDAFVPEGRWVDLADPTPTLDTPLSRFPLFGLLALGVAATTVGMARRALAEAVALAGAKRPQGSRKVLAERPGTQQDVARAEAVVRSCWALLGDVVGDAWATAEAGDPLSVEQRRLLRLAATDATARCADAVRRLHLVAGGADVYRSSAIQRCFRDVHVATQHAMVAERTYELVGRIALGLETDAAQL